MKNPLEMTAAYLEGKLNEAQVAEFEAYLREDPERAEAFVRQAMLDSHLTELLHEQNVQDATADLSGDSQFGVMLNATTPVASPPSHDELPPIHIDTTKLSRQQYVSALSYVIKHTFTPKRVAAFATAAALLLGVVLAIVILTGPDDPTIQPIANAPAPTTPPHEAPAIKPTVATLTNTHNATWAEGASAPGSELHAGQRLTLTAGTAEITTNDGAIAILQAPATVELLDNDNAVELLSGKLVGICETESSKGFLVRTPHMDVTDLGTRFGVDVKPYVATEIHVHQGEVIAAHTAVPGQRNSPPQRVKTNQAVRGTGHENKLAVIATDFSKFHRALSTHRFPGTGFGLAERAVDPNWHVVADANGPLDTPQRLVVLRSHGHYAEKGYDPEVAQWLFFANGDAPYHYPFAVPAGLDSSRLTLESQLSLDNAADLAGKVLYLRFASAEALHTFSINGQSIKPLPDRGSAAGQRIYHELEIPIDQTGLRPGDNHIRIQINNMITPDVFSFYLQWELRPAPSTTQAASAP